MWGVANKDCLLSFFFIVYILVQNTLIYPSFAIGDSWFTCGRFVVSGIAVSFTTVCQHVCVGDACPVSSLCVIIVNQFKV